MGGIWEISSLERCSATDSASSNEEYLARLARKMAWLCCSEEPIFGDLSSKLGCKSLLLNSLYVKGYKMEVLGKSPVQLGSVDGYCGIPFSGKFLFPLRLERLVTGNEACGR